MGSLIHDGLLDSRWAPVFTMGSWIDNGFLVLGTARHGNIWHSTDHEETARTYLARHGSTTSLHGTERDIPVSNIYFPLRLDSTRAACWAFKGQSGTPPRCMNSSRGIFRPNLIIHPHKNQMTFRIFRLGITESHLT